MLFNSKVVMSVYGFIYKYLHLIWAIIVIISIGLITGAFIASLIGGISGIVSVSYSSYFK